jgi:Ras-related protein Rab-1A
LGIEFVETSAKNATNVEKAFMAMSSQIKSKMKTQPAKGGSGGTKLAPGQQVGGKSGCDC